MNTDYVFVFGRTPDLSLAELTAVYPHFSVLSLSQSVVQVSGITSPIQEIQDRLGGVVKIAQVLTQVQMITPESIVECLKPFIVADSVTFALSQTTEPIQRSLLASVKSILQEQGMKSVRFIEAKHGGSLSGGQEKEKGLLELLIVPCVNGNILSLVVSNQDIDTWSKNDYSRPFADPKRGMLPPKVARMVINVALGPDLPGKRLLDPFCGMGTILSESYLLGIEAIGTDIDKTAVLEAQKNVEWFVKTYPSTVMVPTVHVADAVHVASLFPPASFDAIVTEPFLGNPALARRTDVTTEEIKNTIKGLEKLYIGCLKEWHPLLRSGGIIVIALPAFFHQGHKHFVKRVVDSCENFGYSMRQGPFEYARPQAVVHREFYVLTKTENSHYI